MHIEKTQQAVLYMHISPFYFFPFLRKSRHTKIQALSPEPVKESKFPEIEREVRIEYLALEFLHAYNC